jgi:hypothetical protein
MEIPNQDQDEVLALKFALQQASESINEILITIEKDPNITSEGVRNLIKFSLNQLIELSLPELQTNPDPRNKNYQQLPLFNPLQSMQKRPNHPAQHFSKNNSSSGLIPGIVNHQSFTLKSVMPSPQSLFPINPLNPYKQSSNCGDLMPNMQNTNPNKNPPFYQVNSEENYLSATNKSKIKNFINAKSSDNLEPPNNYGNLHLPNNGLPVPSMFQGVKNPPLNTSNSNFNRTSAPSLLKKSAHSGGNYEYQSNEEYSPGPPLTEPRRCDVYEIPQGLSGPPKIGTGVLGPPQIGPGVLSGPPPLMGHVKLGPPNLVSAPSLFSGPPQYSGPQYLNGPPPLSGPPMLGRFPPLAGPPMLGGPPPLSGPSMLGGPPQMPGPPMLGVPPQFSGHSNMRNHCSPNLQLGGPGSSSSLHSLKPSLPESYSSSPGYPSSIKPPNLPSNIQMNPPGYPLSQAGNSPYSHESSYQMMPSLSIHSNDELQFYPFEVKNIPYVLKSEKNEENKKPRENYTEKELEDLNSHEYKLQPNQTREECQICIIDFEENCKITFLNCLHRFHTDCLKLWLMKKNECPACLTKVFLESM